MYGSGDAGIRERRSPHGHGRRARKQELYRGISSRKGLSFYCSALAEDGAKVVTGNLKHFPKTPIVVSPTE